MDMIPSSIGPEVDTQVSGFVPRPDQYAAIQKQFQDTHSLEAERKLHEKLRVFGGWGLAIVFGVFALVSEAQKIGQPLPKDRFEISFVADNGGYSAPIEVKDLSVAQSREVLQNSLINYINYRAGYSYAASQKAYDIVSAMTGGAAQVQYQRPMLNPSDPDSPYLKYGKYGQVVPLNIQLDPDQNSPSSWNFTYTQRIMKGDEEPKDNPMRGVITFAPGPVPLRFRVRYDPASVVVLTYEAHDPTVKGAE